jgi:hypothetical protein
MLGQALGRIDDLRDRLDEVKANPSAVKLMKQPVNVQGIPAYERLHKITCQVWHNHPLTPEMKRKHWTEYQVKLEVETADRMLFHTRISTYSPKHFFAHKKKAACAIGDDVRQFLEYQHSTEYWVGMVLVQPHGGGSIWMPEQVIALHFDQERPQVKLLTDGELIEFTNFRDGHGTKDAADWIATWRREARSSELQDAE